MKTGMWFTIELPSETSVAGLALDSLGSSGDFLRTYKVESSSDGTNWNSTLAEGNGSTLTEIIFKAPQKVRFLRITQIGSSTNYWGINELVLFKP